MDRLGLEHEQLARVGALVGRVDLKLRGAVMHDGHRPRRVRVGQVGVLDEARLERLDGARGAEVDRVLGHGEHQRKA